MNTLHEKVSVIIPTCNRKELLHRAIMSVLNQSYQNIELIVVDDGSNDGTMEMVSLLQEQFSNIIFICHEHSYGANVARNHAVAKSTGTYITGLDDDDEFTPTRVERLMRAYEKRYAFVTSRQIVIRKNNTLKKRRKKTVISFQEILFQNFIGTQGLIEKERLEAINLYDESLQSCQDYDLWIRLMQNYGSVKIIPEFLYVKHDEHEFSKITTSKKAFTGYLQVYKKYRALLTLQQRKRRLFDMYRIRNKKLSFKTMWTLLTWPKEISFSFKLYIFFNPIYYRFKHC